MNRPVRGLVFGSCGAAIAYAAGANWYVTAAVGLAVGALAWPVGIAR